MLKDNILDLLNRSDFMTLSTSVAGNSSAANVYFANDELDIYFFTFNPSRKAVQISINPKHEEYPSLVSESLDVLKLCKWDVAAASSILAITMSQLVKLLRNDPEILTGLNYLRELQGLPRLR